MEKLVRGVIYDDLDLNEMKEDMFEFLERMDDMDRLGELKESIVPHAKNLEMSVEETTYMFKNMDAIAAITRMNPKTFETHNLVIPKESLSKNMVEELSAVDLGKDMMNDYLQHNFDKYECCEENEDADLTDYVEGVYECDNYSSPDEIAMKIMTTSPSNFLVLGDKEQVNAVFTCLNKLKKVG